MSNYDFLTKIVGYDKKVCSIGETIYYDDGTFSVDVRDNENWSTIIITFDKNGNYLDMTW